MTFKRLKCIRTEFVKQYYQQHLHEWTCWVKKMSIVLLQKQETETVMKRFQLNMLSEQYCQHNWKNNGHSWSYVVACKKFVYHPCKPRAVNATPHQVDEFRLWERALYTGEETIGDAAEEDKTFDDFCGGAEKDDKWLWGAHTKLSCHTWTAMPSIAASDVILHCRAITVGTGTHAILISLHRVYMQFMK